MQGSALIKGTIVLPGGETALYNASSGPPVIRHKDWLGSSRLATTWAHGVQSKTSYAPFGETYNEAGTADRSFTGQDQDTVTGSAATGVYDYLFRKYDPAAGRWLSPDPYGWGAVSLDDPQSLNRYAYVENRPLDAIDPLGLVQCSSSDNKTVQESGTNGCDNLGSGWNYFISTCSGPACNQPPAPTPPPTQPTPPTPPSPPVTCLTYGTCVQPGPNPTPGSGNQGGSGTSAPNGGQHLTPQQAHEKDCAALQRLATFEGRATDFLTVAGGVAVGSIVATGGIDAPAAAPVGLAFFLGGAATKGLQWGTKIFANSVGECSILLSTD